MAKKAKKQTEKKAMIQTKVKKDHSVEVAVTKAQEKH